MTDVQLLYLDGCPNWQETDRRLRQALDQDGDSTEVERVPVETVDDADRLGLRGSPTVLIDGTDPFADPGAPVGLSCRLFATPDGLRGAPTVDQLARALATRAR